MSFRIVNSYKEMEETNISDCSLLYSGPLYYILLEKIKTIYTLISIITFFPYDHETAVTEITQIYVL